MLAESLSATFPGGKMPIPREREGAVSRDAGPRTGKWRCL
jgi:hypothetical protein